MRARDFSYFIIGIILIAMGISEDNNKIRLKNMAKELKNLTKRSENYSQWFNDLVMKADLAEQSAVRGCMTIKPYGYAIWEKMQHQLDTMFKETGVQNAYFPLLIPKNFFAREAEHVKGFAKECAVVTHYRLRTTEDGSDIEVDPAAKLEEELIIRPTSETIIWNTYKNWIHSYRDLPLMCNQWCNVMRWEMRTRPFLRTSEFLWQEGHTAHATKEEAEEEAKKMLHVYAEFCEKWLAIPVVQGVKSETERFAGALNTYTIEAMMKDGKALQSGTSHYFGDKFSKAYDVTFTGRDNQLHHPYQTSWGVSTRLVGAIIMTHGDDDGLILPPAVAPIQVVVVPIAAHKPGVSEKAAELAEKISKYARVKLDDSDNAPGWKFSQWEMKGVPLRLEIGPKDLEKNQCVLVRRDTREKIFVSLDELETAIPAQLEALRKDLYERALKNREERTWSATTMDEVKALAKANTGYIKTMWCGDLDCELKMKEEAGLSSRCMPFEQEQISDVCPCCGKPATKMVYWGIAY